MCSTQPEKAPWFAIDYGKNVVVDEVIIYNRDDCCHDRTRNVSIFLADTLPTLGSEEFSGGKKIGNFKGPGKKGEKIVIKTEQIQAGRYLIIQIYDNDEEMILNLKEVQATGAYCLSGRKSYLGTIMW